MMVQTKCKLNNTELFFKVFHIQCKEIGNNKYYMKNLQQNLKNGKVRFRLNIDVRKELEYSRLNFILLISNHADFLIQFGIKLHL